MIETPTKPGKPITGERAFQDTDKKHHARIVAYVNARKSEYFGSPEYKTYINRVNATKKLINQDTSDMATRFKMRHAITRAGHDNLVDSLDDLFDVDDLVSCMPEGNQSKQMATDWQNYTNKLLRSIHHQQHLSDRFLYLPDYGWSIAHDFYQFSDGWQVKAQAKPILPQMEGFNFEMQEDVYLDRPASEIIRNEHWFGDANSGRDQRFQGTLKRWYLKDVYSAKLRKDKAGNPLYNLPELEKLCNLMAKGHQDADEFYKAKESTDGAGKDVEFKGDKNRGPYVDVIRFHGPLNDIADAELSQDPNEYYVECTRSCLLRWQENPRDRFTTYTHARSHPYRNTPFSRSYLDSMKADQQFSDFLVCMAAESITDNLTKHWAYWEEDMLDPGDFTSPKGLNAFLILQGEGRLPQVVGEQRSGAFSDVKDLLTIFDRDRQRAGSTDQEQGVQGGTQDKTATAARLLASATSKKIRAMVKRVCGQAVIPQVKNLVMLSLVHGKPENLKAIAADGSESRLTGEHLKWFMRAFQTDTMITVHDTITRDRNEEAMRLTAFMQLASQMQQVIPPDAMAKVLRLAADMGGIKQTVIDDIIPPPLPIEASTPDGSTVAMPSAMAMPQPGMPPPALAGQPQPMQGVNENASMAAPSF